MRPRCSPSGTRGSGSRFRTSSSASTTSRRLRRRSPSADRRGRESLSYAAPHTRVPMLRPRAVGARVPRVEDARLLTGRGAFIAALTRPRSLDVGFVRSPVAHGVLQTVDTAAAAAVDGVALVWTTTDVRPLCAGLRAGLTTDGLAGTVQPLLADGAVRYVGEPIAAVVGADAYVVEDAVGLVDADIEPRTAVVGWEESDLLANDTLETNVAYERERSFGPEAPAGHAVAGRFVYGRVTQLPIETCGCLAEYDWATGRLTLWTSTQMPFLVRSLLAEHIDVPEHLIDVVAPDVGGGFGQKGNLFPEEILVCLLARELGVPVRWIED